MRIAVLDQTRSSFGLRDGSIFAVFDRNRDGGVVSRRQRQSSRRPQRVIVNQFAQGHVVGNRKIARAAEMARGYQRTADPAELLGGQIELRKYHVRQSNRTDSVQ